MERITITIEDQLLKQIDATVDGEKIKNRSHAIDLLLRQSLVSKSINTAVILASGPKEKLQSHGSTIKPLVVVNGKPVIVHVVEKLVAAGVSRFVIVLGYGAEEVKQTLSHFEPSLKFEFIFEDKPAGSAASLALARTKVNEQFFLSYSDVYYPDLDLGDLVAYHRENGKSGVCTMALVNVTTPNVFGVAKLTGHRITSFTEKPKSGTDSNLVNAGIAICDPAIFTELPKSGSFEKAVFPTLAEKNKLFAYVYSGKWQDVGQ